MGEDHFHDDGDVEACGAAEFEVSWVDDEVCR